MSLRRSGVGWMFKAPGAINVNIVGKSRNARASYICVMYVLVNKADGAELRVVCELTKLTERILTHI
jgi:hypothetical protein